MSTLESGSSLNFFGRRYSLHGGQVSSKKLDALFQNFSEMETGAQIFRPNHHTVKSWPNLVDRNQAESKI